MATYVVNVNDPTTPTNDQGAKQGAEELRAIKLKLQQIIAGALITSAAAANPADLTSFVYPDINDRPALVAGGWLPWSLNQQWGGAGSTPYHLIDSTTGTEYKFDAFDAYIDDDTNNAVGDNAARNYQYQSILPGRAIGLQAIWAKFYKTLNPVDNLILKLWSVAGGVPNAVVATANVISGKQITSDTDGAWYRFVFGTVVNLTANTQFIITVEKSGGIDAANFYNWKSKAVTKYPFNLSGVGTVVPAWTPALTTSRLFICEPQITDNVFQAGGQFAGRLVGNECAVITKSVGFCKPLSEFFPLFNPNGWSLKFSGKSWTKDRPICDLVWGLHHDRINIRTAAATGFCTVTIYKTDGTVVGLAGISDLSTAEYKDIMITGRSLGDGVDTLRIYVGVGGVWTKEAELTGQNFTFDPLFQRLGTAWLLGGFSLWSTANYTKLSDMGTLPSADGWTYNGVATEGLVFAVANNKLSQISAGNTGAQDGYYSKMAAGLVNANGWAVVDRSRVIKNTNTKDQNGAVVRVQDGTKTIQWQRQEYYNDFFGAATLALAQSSNKKLNDNTHIFCGRGADSWAFENGKLIFDGMSINTTASATNQVDFGDVSVTAAENADIEWDYVGRLDTGVILPQFTGGELHEFAVWSGDKNVLGATLYNAGVPFSVKQYCGVNRNYIGESRVQKLAVVGITSAPTSAVATYAVAPEMEAFIIATALDHKFSTEHSHTVDGGGQLFTIAIDGSFEVARHERKSAVSGPGGFMETSNQRFENLKFGLHKSEARWATASGATATLSTRKRSLIVEGRV